MEVKKAADKPQEFTLRGNIKRRFACTIPLNSIFHSGKCCRCELRISFRTLICPSKCKERKQCTWRWAHAVNEECSRKGHNEMTFRNLAMQVIGRTSFLYSEGGHCKSRHPLPTRYLEKTRKCHVEGCFSGTLLCPFYKLNISCRRFVGA